MSPIDDEIYVVHAAGLGEMYAFTQRDIADAVAHAVGADPADAVRILDREAGRALILKHFEDYNGYPPPTLTPS